MTTHHCCLESSFDGVLMKGSIPHSRNYHKVPIKIESLVYCKSDEKSCASPHNLSLLLEKVMCNDPCFKSRSLLINNDDSFDIKNDNGLSSIDDEEQPRCNLKVKVLDDIFEKYASSKMLSLD